MYIIFKSRYNWI